MAVTTIPFNPMDLEYIGNITANDNLDNLQPGIYYLRDAQPINCPPYHWQWSYLFVLNPNTSVIQEWIIRPSSMSIVMREKSGNPMVWSEWFEIEGGPMQYRDVTTINVGSHSYVKYWRRGCTATVYCLYDPQDGNIAAWNAKTLTVLPATMRPSSAIMARGIVDRVGAEGVMVSITTGGAVNVGCRYNPLEASGAIVQATLTYAI